MTDERRYSDDEVEAIFRSAAMDAAALSSPAREGLTLAEVQEIGREVGMSPEQIAAAAGRLEEVPAIATRQAVLGVPISVGRTADLPRAPKDREWSVLVAELREIFGAHGRESSSAGTRSWHNGNLRIVIEPTETGMRLRMRTRKGSAGSSLGMGGVFFILGIFFLLTSAEQAGEIAMPLLFILVGVGSVAVNALLLPGWAAEREEQMEHIARRTTARLARPPVEESPERCHS